MIDMKDVVFTTYSFGPLYVYQQERLRQSILKIYPDANLRCWKDLDGASSPQEGRPPGAKPFSESMYGFKVHCIENCRREGFRFVIFLDAAMILEEKIDDILENATKLGVLAALDRAALVRLTSDACLKGFGRTRESIKDMTLVGGSVYVFDFSHPVARRVYSTWYAAESAGLFGSEAEDRKGLLQGHRKDETCMALALDKHGAGPVSEDTLGYHNLGSGNVNRKFSFYKLHFKGIAQLHDHSFNQSIIPMHGNILDLGCRDFKFADFFRNLEYNVHCVDVGKFEGDYDRVAIHSYDGECYVQHERDPDATHITSMSTGDPIKMMSLESYTTWKGVSHWDLIKMDIEGSELAVLDRAKHPIASQVTVEFHAHCGQRKEDIDALLDKLEEFYYIHNRVWDEQHSAGFNYWDVLLIAKEPLA